MQAMIGNWEESIPGGQYSRSPLLSKSADLRMAKKISGFCTQYSDTGLFGIYAVGEAQALDDLMFNVQGFVTDFSYQVDEELLEQAKKQMIIQYLGICDGSTQVRGLKIVSHVHQLTYTNTGLRGSWKAGSLLRAPHAPRGSGRANPGGGFQCYHGSC
eukprot:1025327-Amorphochlora_amoeboformis.AAC.1